MRTGHAPANNAALNNLALAIVVLRREPGETVPETLTRLTVRRERALEVILSPHCAARRQAGPHRDQRGRAASAARALRVGGGVPALRSHERTAPVAPPSRPVGRARGGPCIARVMPGKSLDPLHANRTRINPGDPRGARSGPHETLSDSMKP